MKLYGLVGWPLGHSFSAGYFAERFALSGLADECRYENFPVERIEELRAALPADIQGFNVTIPHKRNILPLLAEMDPAAQEIGAVNCVQVLPDGGWRGYNTDAAGFEVSLRGFLRSYNGPLQGLKALVLGGGGAAAAVEHTLGRSGIAKRQVSRHAAACQLLYEELTPELVRAHRLIINTTPLGMAPNVETKPPIPYEGITPEHYLYDLVYNPSLTAFLREGCQRGAWSKNGLEMLTQQAELAWEIWNSPARSFGTLKSG